MVKKVAFYPLTHSQKGIWYTEQFFSGTGINNITGMIRLFVEIDYVVLEKAINLVLKNNDAFRLRLTINGDELQQFLIDYRYRRIKFADHFNSMDELTVWLEEYAAQPMEVLDSDLMEFTMVKTKTGETAICLKAHHLISDAWSMGLVAKELVDYYNCLIDGKEIYGPWPSYLKQIEAERQYMLSPEFEEARKFWNHKFYSLPELTTLKPRQSSNRNIQAKRKTFVISAELNERIEKYCVTNKISGFIFFLSVMAIFLSKLTRKTDIVTGTPILNRPSVEDKLTMGMFIDTIPVRLQVDYEMTLADFVQYVNREWKEMRQYKYPYDLILNDIRDKHKVQGLLYDITLSYQKLKINVEQDFDTQWFFNGYQTNSLVVNISDRNNQGRLNFEIDYQIEIYNEESIERFFTNLLAMIEDIMQNPDQYIYEIEFLPAEEREKVLYEFNDTKHTYPHNKTIGQLLQEQVKRNPNKTALVFEDKQLTYYELNRKANQLARFLRSKGVGPDVVVGVMIERSLEMLIGILGIIKAGGAYLPLDPDYPSERLTYMLQDGDCRYLLTQKNLAEEIKFSGVIIDILDERSYDRNGANIKNINRPSDLLYVYYTSGSTGHPKGVMIEHRSLINFIYGVSRIIDFGPGATVASVTTIAFDIFVFENMPTLLSGGTVVLVSEEEQINSSRLGRLLVQQKITTLLTTPSRIRLLAADPECQAGLKGLKEIMVGGDIFPDQLLHDLRKLTDARIINGYGPTEITVGATFAVLDGEKEINIGKPIANTRIYVLDRYNRLQPIGVPGELCISGDGLARGYLNRENITAEKFVANPYEPGKLMYRTGDLVRWLPAGDLEYLGRIDNQVKIGGFRIELGEIENRLAEHPAVKQAAVITDTDGEGNRILGAFLTFKKKVSAVELREFLSNTLPDFMIPAYFAKLDEFPLNAAGKIDRKKLLDIYDKSLLATEWVPPRNTTERILASLWAEVLKIKGIGIKDNFFSMGGDSLKVLRVLTKTIPYEWNLTARDFYNYPTIEKLAQKIHGNLIDQIVMASETIVQRNKRTNPEEISISGKKLRLGSVLLTGSTGFLGAHLLNEILTSSEAKVYCLVRSKDETRSDKRLLDVLKLYFPEQSNDLFGQRIIVIDGDVTDTRLGLTDEQYEELGKTVDCVIHAAALVKHLGHWEEFRNINVIGTMNVIDFCKDFGIQMNHISTTSVSGQFLLDTNVGSSNFTEDDFYIGQDYMGNVYVRSKFEAENVVFKAVEEGLDANIFRVGMLTGRYSDGFFQVNITENGFYNRLKALVMIGAAPINLLNQFLEFTPVDVCAKAIIRLIMIPEVHNKVFHMSNSSYVQVSDVLKAFESKGYVIDTVNADKFLDQIKSLARRQEGEEALMWLINDIVIAGGEPLSVPFINVKSDFTEAYLHKAGFTWPKIDSEYLNKLIGHMVDRNYLIHKKPS